MDNEHKEYIDKVKKVTDAIMFETLTSAFRHCIINDIEDEHEKEAAETLIDVFVEFGRALFRNGCPLEAIFKALIELGEKEKSDEQSV